MVWKISNRFVAKTINKKSYESQREHSEVILTITCNMSPSSFFHWNSAEPWLARAQPPKRAAVPAQGTLLYWKKKASRGSQVAIWYIPRQKRILIRTFQRVYSWSKIQNYVITVGNTHYVYKKKNSMHWFSKIAHWLADRHNGSPLQSTIVTLVGPSCHQPDLPVMKSLFNQFVTVIFFTHALEPQPNNPVK